MNRGSSSLVQRPPLSATEELEKLEQSITLTLQEIDHNFSKAHRIVTSSILPVVEQYGEHCRAVWDASKFWKQFFEAAANVSLSGYEELAQDGNSTAADDTVHNDGEAEAEEGNEGETTTNTTTTTGADFTPQRGQQAAEDRDESMLLLDDDMADDVSGSTPRPPAGKRVQQPKFADIDSPYEALRKELRRGRGGGGNGGGEGDSSMLAKDVNDGHGGGGNDSDDSSTADSELLAQRTARLPDMSMTPRQSPDERYRQALEDKEALARRQKDPLLHRVLDKTYRIQATPHKRVGGRQISPMRLKVTDRALQHQQQQQQLKQQQQQQEPTGTGGVGGWLGSSPMSSPEMAVPKLRSAAFLSPMRTTGAAAISSSSYRSRLAAAAAAPRTPGVSVQTPARTRQPRTSEVVFDDIGTAQRPAADKATSKEQQQRKKRDPDEITWESSGDDDDDDDADLYGGMSPPKTINFALPPSKLLQTPAREASKRIVEDILYTAGEDLDEKSEYSPTMVKMNANILDETF